MYNWLVTPSFPPSILSIYHDTDSLINFNSLLLLCNIENGTHAQIRKVQNHHNPRHKRRRRLHITRLLKIDLYIYIEISNGLPKRRRKRSYLIIFNTLSFFSLNSLYLDFWNYKPSVLLFIV